jgi:hypothetical protein
VLVSVLLPRFDLAVTLAARGVELAGAPAALAPAEGAGAQIGTPNAVAAAAGVRAGMRTSEALALCPTLALHPPDPMRVRAAGERLCVALEETGAQVEPIEDGLVLLDERPLQRMLGGREGVLRALASWWRVRDAMAVDVRPGPEGSGWVIRVTAPPGIAHAQTLVAPFDVASAATGDGRALPLYGSRRIALPDFSGTLEIQVARATGS